MEKLEKISTILQKAGPMLAKFLGIDDAFLRLLVAEGVITSEESEIIKNIKVRSQKVDRLLEIIRGTDNAYDGFMSLLGDPDNNKKDIHKCMKQLEEEVGLSK